MNDELGRFYKGILFEVIDFTVHTGAKVSCAKRGSTLVPLGKVEIYGMGKVKMWPQDELNQLQKMKQKNRKEYDKNPQNEQRLKKIKILKKNYERSQAMFEAVKQVGMVGSVEDIENIIDNLLDVGEELTVDADDTGRQKINKIDAPNGQLKVISTWKVLPDGTKYLATINFIPQGFS
ncbi:MAG: hypothetical protein F6J96_03240 [Symploca sp. SIO1C2]|nr:hypothetical protein [Symploca sp. SIO1C2]